MKSMNKIVGLAFIAMSLFMYNCSEDNGGGSNIPSELISGTKNFSGPGSFWTASLDYDNETFEIDQADEFGGDVNFTVTGGFERLDSGFLKMTVDTVTPENLQDGPANGDAAYALEIPGFALILKPLDGDEIIPMLIGGDCPEDTFEANWVIAQNTNPRPANDDEQDWFGIFRAVSDGNGNFTPSIPSYYALEGFTEVPVNDPGFNALECNDGFGQLTNGNDVQANMWFTSSGGVMVETFENGDRNSTILALPAEEFTIADLEGTWNGLVIDEDSDNEVDPATITLDSSGEGTGQKYTDIEANEVESGGVSVQLNNANSPLDGFVTGTLNNDTEIACTVAFNVAGSSKDLMFCNGQNPNDVTKVFSLVMTK